MLCLGAANRDPRKFDDPDEFQLDRKNVREHIAFGRGIHTCAGAPLARVEGRVTINRLLDRMSDIRISEAEHGPAGIATTATSRRSCCAGSPNCTSSSPRAD